jgi:hypothetical protein
MDEMSSPASPPPAPDPVATANAQTASNKATSTTQQELNSTNQVTPQGTLTYSQNGTWADGTPQYTATTTLSPEQQQLYDQQTATQGKIGNIASNQADSIGNLLSTPVDLSNDAMQKSLFDLGSKRLDPQFARDWDSQETTLMNRGIMPGSDQYTQAQDAFNRSKNDAYDQLALTGQGQAAQLALQARNQPINEITALMSGGQVSMPNFGSTPQSSVANTDVAGITQQGYQNSLLPWQTQTNYNNAMMGGLFGLGGAALGGWGMSGFKGIGGK